MSNAILKLAIFFLVGAGMASVPIMLSFLLWRKPKRDLRLGIKDVRDGSDATGQTSNVNGQMSHVTIFDTSKMAEPYESGMPAVGSGRAVGFEYFIYAILFLFFDVIAVMLFLGVVAVRQNRTSHVWPFATLLVLSLLIIAYGIKKRNYFII